MSAKTITLVGLAKDIASLISKKDHIAEEQKLLRAVCWKDAQNRYHTALIDQNGILNGESEEVL